MAGGPPPKFLMKAFVAFHNFFYRLSGGTIGGTFGRRFQRGSPVLLLTVRGRRSGNPMTVPLIYVPTEQGVAVIASFAGSPTHPAWYLNLVAQGVADVQIGRRHLHAKAETLDPNGERYAGIWRQAVAVYPDYETYRMRTARRMPIVELIVEN